MDVRVEAMQEQLPDVHQARKRGGLLFGYFLLATQEKVARPPKEDETLLILIFKPWLWL